jgi:transcriptional regulator with XRE-family HTH domain
MITASQIKAARLFLGWEQRDLAGKSGLSLPTIQRMEKLGVGRSTVDNAERVQCALEVAGIEFIPAGAYQGDGGPGVRLRKDAPQPADEKMDRIDR